MDGVTYAPTRDSAPAAGKLEKIAQARRGWFARFMEALCESRRQQAHREIRRHAHLLPCTWDERGDDLVRTGANGTPFGV